MIKKKTWKEFKKTGLLWWINTQLHLFGWALVYNYDDKGNITNVYPAKCKFKGFDEKTNDKGYQDVTKYMKDNAEQLYKETME